MALNEYQKKQVIAVGSGWTRVKDVHSEALPGPYWNDPSGRYMGGMGRDPLPDYFKSVDACQEAIATCLLSKHWDLYLKNLAIECNVDSYADDDQVRIMLMCNASAQQRAEAIYKTFLYISQNTL